MYDNFNNLTIYYEKYGNSKETIIILPGWGNTKETFRYIINKLKETHTVYILDYPGLGKSPIPNKDLTLDDYTKIIIDFMNKLKITNPTIIAHSFGGRITALLAGKYKIQIDKIILFDVAGLKEKKQLKLLLKQSIYKLLKKLIKLLPKLKQQTYNQKLLSHFASADYKNLPLGMHQTFKNIIKDDLASYYKQITQETLLIWGDLDKDTPLYQAYKLRKIIKNSALIIYKNAYHFSYLNYPILTNNIIKSFLKLKTP